VVATAARTQQLLDASGRTVGLESIGSDYCWPEQTAGRPSKSLHSLLHERDGTLRSHWRTAELCTAAAAAAVGTVGAGFHSLTGLLLQLCHPVRVMPSHLSHCVRCVLRGTTTVTGPAPAGGVLRGPPVTRALQQSTAVPANLGESPLEPVEQ